MFTFLSCSLFLFCSKYSTPSPSCNNRSFASFMISFACSPFLTRLPCLPNINLYHSKSTPNSSLYRQSPAPFTTFTARFVNTAVCTCRSTLHLFSAAIPCLFSFIATPAFSLHHSPPRSYPHQDASCQIPHWYTVSLNISFSSTLSSGTLTASQHFIRLTQVLRVFTLFNDCSHAQVF